MPERTLIPAALQLQMRHEDWDINFMLEEATVLFRAEVVLQNELNNPEKDPDLLQKRAVFIGPAIAIVKAQREARWRELYERLKVRFER